MDAQKDREKDAVNARNVRFSWVPQYRSDQAGECFFENSGSRILIL